MTVLSHAPCSHATGAATPARPSPVVRAVACRVVALAGILLLPTACSLFEDEERLEGTRIPVRGERSTSITEPAPEGGASGGENAPGGETAPGLSFQSSEAIVAPSGGAPLPPPRALDAWTQTNAVPSHNAGHLSGPAALQRAWTADAGTGNSDEARITSAPVVADGRVFTLDAAAEVRAFDTDNGALLWAVSVAPGAESGEEGFGGGLAILGTRVFATTGFGEIVGIEARSGEIVWRTSLGAPFRAAPAAANGVIVAVTRDNKAFGVSAETGDVLWRAPAAVSGAGLLGGASPAIASGAALLPYSSGELVAVQLGNGRRFWSAVLSGGRRGLARSAISDVTGDPVVIGPLAIAANQAGRIVAIEGRTGRRVWTRSFGAVGPLWAAGDTLFMVSDASELLRLSARNGATIWSTPLPAFEDPEDREDPIGYSGPVLVEGRILVTASTGEILAFEGVGGQAVATTPLTGGSITGPVVAEGTVFVLTDEATLEAFR
ncbi:MAG: PQQ-binding-like beta-propeller repeat protein [Pseudomonadota bacterium]